MTNKKLPDFVIIGAQRCGTTSLYNSVTRHPSILPATRKEIHYFDLNFKKGIEWYQSQFPDQKEGTITGEASPYYIFHPLVPKRMHDLLQDIKIIILLRNPISRVISHYLHEKITLMTETLPFPEAIRNEESRLSGEESRILQEKDYYSFAHQHYSYLARGRYAEQIDRWVELFDRKQIMIVKSEEMFSNPNKVVGQILQFLGLSNDIMNFDFPHLNNQQLSYVGNRNVVLDVITLQLMRDYFKEPNIKLYEKYGIDFRS
jgi:hypothetical protein